MNTNEEYNKKSKTDEKIISPVEYRKVLNDNTSSEEQIINRINYLEAFCRNIIKIEIEKYASKIRQKK